MGSFASDKQERKTEKLRQKMLKLVCFLTVFLELCLAGNDAEDLIARGYSCSLAPPGSRESLDVNTEVLCDDGICIECTKAPGGAPGTPLARRMDDLEDSLLAGYLCAEETRGAAPVGSERVCEDRVCYTCTKAYQDRHTDRTLWGDVEQGMIRGDSCFSLPHAVPDQALWEGVKVICEEQGCFGCLKM